MGFFKREHKRLANVNYKDLQECYHITEENLKSAVKSGNEKEMKRAMKEHQQIEYALLYKNSSEYKKKKFNK